METETNEKIKQTSEQIEKLKNSNFNRIQKVKQEMAKEEADFQMKVADFQCQKQEITKSTSENMSKIQGEFDLKIKDTKAQHAINVNKLKQRIESAKKNQESYLSETNKEIKKAQSNDDDLIHRKCNEDLASIEAASKSFIEKDHKLADKTRDLSKSYADLSLKIENPMQMRNSEKVELMKQNQKVEQEDASLQRIFDDLYVKIDKMAKNPRFIIPPDIANSSSNPNLNNDDMSPFPDSSSSSSSAPSSKQMRVKEPSEPLSSRSNARRNSKSARTMAPRSARSERGSIPLKNMRTLREPQIV